MKKNINYLLENVDKLDKEDYELLQHQCSKLIFNFCVNKKIELGLEKDDLYSCINQQITEFKKNYNGSVTPVTYIYKGLLTSAIRRSKKASKHILNEVPDTYDYKGEQLSLFDTIPYFENYNTNIEQIIVKNDKLTVKDKKICVLISRGFTYEEIGKEFGVSRQAINGTLKRISKKVTKQDLQLQ